MTKILLIAEHDNHHLKPANSAVLAAARQLNDTVSLLLVGNPVSSLVESVSQFAFVSEVLTAAHPVYAHFMPENVCPLIAEIAVGYDYVMMPATTFGKNLLPRVAALLGVSMVADVCRIVAPDTFERPIFAGNATATVQLTETIKLLTVRTTAFRLGTTESTGATAAIKTINRVIENTCSRFVTMEQQSSSRPELTAARIVVSGGRGLKNKENFHMLEAFADSIGAAVGASRAAVDAGFAPNDWQVGQTGKIVAPELYIAVGISGAIQHLAGMKDSRVVVAINSDPEAPIFQAADFGLVGDLFQILPALQTAFQERNKDRA